jgi:hypothetical protein
MAAVVINGLYRPLFLVRLIIKTALNKQKKALAPFLSFHR